MFALVDLRPSYGCNYRLQFSSIYCNYLAPPNSGGKNGKTAKSVEKCGGGDKARGGGKESKREMGKRMEEGGG